MNKLHIDYEEFHRLGYDKDSYLIVLKDGASIKVANQLYESGYFDYAQPSFMRFMHMCDTNPDYGVQWGLNNTGQFGGTSVDDINAPEAWTMTRGCNNIKIALIDQGVDLTHPDLEDNLLTGYDATDGAMGGLNGACSGNDAHGTACAGIIAAVNNYIGVEGVAPNCKIIPIRVSYTNNSSVQIWNDDWIVTAINHAWDTLGADILSCSWAGNTSVLAVNNEISAALTQGRHGLGCIVVFAAGNNNSSVLWPANSNANILAVGAMSPCGERKSPSSCDGENWGSNYGPELDLVAPGVKIYTTDIQGSAGNNTNSGTSGDYYALFNGTSAATPFVSGVAALVLSVDSTLTGQQVRDIIESSCSKIGNYTYSTTSGRTNGTWNNEMGYGLVNAYAALKNIDISGPDAVYTSAAFSLSFSKPGVKTIWTISPSNGTLYISSQNDTSAVVTNHGWYTSSFTLTAKIANLSSDTIVLTKTISANSCPVMSATYSMQPCYNQNGIYNQPVNLDGTPNFIYYGCPVDITFSTYGVPISCQLTSGTPLSWYFNGSNYLQVSINSPVTFKIYPNGQDGACTKTLLLMPTGTYHSYTLAASPNPASTTLNVNLVATTAATNDTTLATSATIASSNTTTENITSAPAIISLYDMVTNNMVKQWKFQDASVISFPLNVSDLRRGMYILKVNKGDLLLTTKVILK